MQSNPASIPLLSHPSLDQSGGRGTLTIRQSPAPLLVESTDLLRGHKTIDIHHNGAVYRLQQTKLGKLILTK